MPRLANPEAYYAVKDLVSRGKLSASAFQVYEALWHKGPLKQPVLLEMMDEVYGKPPKNFRKRWISRLLIGGLLSEDADGFLDVTDQHEIASAAQVHRPHRNVIRRGVEDIEIALIRAEHVGANTEDAQKVIAWLKGSSAFYQDRK